MEGMRRRGMGGKRSKKRKMMSFSGLGGEDVGCVRQHNFRLTEINFQAELLLRKMKFNDNICSCGKRCGILMEEHGI